MTIWRRLRRRRGWTDRARLNRELQEEIASHLAEAEEELSRQGRSPDEARLAARRQFGGVTRATDQYREGLSSPRFDQIWRDCRQAWRSLVRTPASSLVIFLVLGVGTGALLAVLTLLQSIVLRPLPFPGAERLVAVRHRATGLDRPEMGISSGLYFQYARHSRSLEGMAVYRDTTVQNLQTPGAAAERVHVTMSSAALFQTLGVHPLLGRLFTEEDGRPGFMNMRWKIPILLSHDFWRSRFGGDPDIIGRVLMINENPREVVGVLPRAFVFPDERTQIWLLIEPTPASAQANLSFTFNAVGRLTGNATPSIAESELSGLLAQIAGTAPSATSKRLDELRLAPRVVSLKSSMIGDIADVLWPLVGGVVLLLVIACANAASLFLLRAEHRRREVAVRTALGASRRQLAGLFFVEAAMLTLAAAAIGLLLAHGLVRAAIAYAPFDLPRVSEIGLDPMLCGLAAALALASAIVYCAFAVQRNDAGLASHLIGGGERTSVGAGARWRRDALIVVQVALALGLLVASALMVATYRNLTRRDLGFSPTRMLTAEVSLVPHRAPRHIQIYREMVDRLRQLPGVEAAAAASSAPLATAEHLYPTQPDRPPVVFKFFVPGYFQAMRIPVEAGTQLDDPSSGGAGAPVLISRELVRRAFSTDHVTGQTIARLNRDGTPVDVGGQTVPPFTIAGIAADVREISLRDGPTEIVYIPLTEPPVERSLVPTRMTIFLRTIVPPLSLASAVRQTISGVDSGLTVANVRTMDAVVRAARGRETFVGVALSFASAMSVFLGLVGIHGSVAGVVRQRRREIGIRAALGARRSELVRLVVTGSLATVVIGAAVGVALAAAGTGVLAALLFGVSRLSPLVFLAATATLLGAATATALLAGWRAARVAPVIALRGD